MFLVLFQLALLILTAWGWGYWLRRIVGTSHLAGWRQRGWFFFGLAGFTACILFLQGLVYLDLPLKYSGWIGLAVALAGLVGSLWEGVWSRDTRHRWREPVAAGLVFAAVFGCQSIPLFRVGPANYYGSAHVDQVNYVLLGEFLAEKPFSTSQGDIGLQPWVAKPLALKNYRIGQSVSNGYLGVISLSDAKRSYGTLTIFMVGLGALSVFLLARILGVPLVTAALAAVWWGVLPAVTKVHLDGFLSQTCILFVFPAMAAAFYARRGRLERVPLALLTFYLAYLLCTYTEVYALGVGLLVCLLILATQEASWGRRLSAGATVVAGSLVLNGGYLRSFAFYIGSQYQSAASNAKELVGLVPMSGTWIGWKQIFFGYIPFADARLERLSLLVSFGFLFLIGCAFQIPGLAKRRFLLAIVAPAAGVLALLLSAAEFAKYPFAKLLDTFTTFWLLFALLGAQTLWLWLTRRRAARRAVMWMVTGSLVVLALLGSWPQWRATMENQGTLAAVNSPTARLCYRQARREPDAVYLIDEPNSILCAWLVYAARHSQVYVDADHISDLPIPLVEYAFRRFPVADRTLVVLNEKGFSRMKPSEHPPVIVVNNPQGSEGSGENVAYWLGPEIALDLVDNQSLPDGPSRRFSLVFDAAAGPANPLADRTLVLVDPDGSNQQVSFANSTRCHFAVDLHPGKNSYFLRVAAPTEQTVRIPGDPRNHMVMLQHFGLINYTATP